MSRPYTPRRASQRWLEGAPDHILDCFHNVSGTWDVLYTGILLSQRGEGLRTYANCYLGGREMSADPHHPQGVGMWFELTASEAALYRYRNGHKRVKWKDLPEKVRECAIRDGKSEEATK